MRQRRPRNTATTRFPGNQKTLQEELPEGGTHIRLGDVSCKSLVVGSTGYVSNSSPHVITCCWWWVVLGVEKLFPRKSDDHVNA